MVGYPSDVEELVFNKILFNLKPGSFLVDHTTSSPALAEKIYTECAKREIHSLDCPVSGGDVGALNGCLSIMCGGDQQSFDKVKFILDCYGKTVRLIAPKPGMGQQMKLANQVTVANNLLGLCEGMV
eukprot:CAMPEP_0116893754 /NCGR_PEP_ID=MMETSP0467-20121206/3685_1 /TAXON_ID=283647 /ORGANISM="Mesodinium pulex, Strain SPMC105" /LENGTH=126 /DNA_ID=CAMNT_0004563615 /DNA_START=109 /DNA_END=489 /DNA_ORIENTATION=-